MRGEPIFEAGDDDGGGQCCCQANEQPWESMPEPQGQSFPAGSVCGFRLVQVATESGQVLPMLFS